MSKENLTENITQVSLAEKRKLMAEEVRQYAREQVEIWRQIPNWALEADGHSGYSDNYQRAYYGKFFPLTQGRYGYEGCIDLKTGELIYHPIDIMSAKRANLSDDAVLNINPDLINAASLLDEFKKVARKGYWGGYNPREIIQNKADIREHDQFLQESQDPEFSLEGQKQRLNSAINVIEKLARSDKSELTQNQALNAINHVLRASDYDEREDGSGTYSPVNINIRGVHELMQCVAFYMELESQQFTPLFAMFSNAIWLSATQVAREVRKERGLKHFEDPEPMYKVLGAEYTKRADGNAYMFAKPPKSSLKKEGVPIQIADWLINVSAY